MSHAYAYKDDPAERERVAAALAKMGVTYPTRTGTEGFNDNPMKRQPLGLRPADDDDGAARADDEYLGPQATAEKIIAGSLAMLSAEQRSATATMEDLWTYGITTSLELSFEGGDDLRKRTKELRAEIEALKTERRVERAEQAAVIAELRSEISQMRSIQEAARVASRGEEGREGPRGIPGAQGPAGPRGKAGERGAAAAMIVGWETTPERYWLTPVYSTGEKGVPANLRSLFEAYDQSVTEADDEA
jgi:hypothetical protein